MEQNGAAWSSSVALCMPHISRTSAFCINALSDITQLFDSLREKLKRCAKEQNKKERASPGGCPRLESSFRKKKIRSTNQIMPLLYNALMRSISFFHLAKPFSVQLVKISVYRVLVIKRHITRKRAKSGESNSNCILSIYQIGPQMRELEQSCHLPKLGYSSSPFQSFTYIYICA